MQEIVGCCKITSGAWYHEQKLTDTTELARLLTRSTYTSTANTSLASLSGALQQAISWPTISSYNTWENLLSKTAAGYGHMSFIVLMRVIIWGASSQCQEGTQQQQWLKSQGPCQHQQKGPLSASAKDSDTSVSVQIWQSACTQLHLTLCDILRTDSEKAAIFIMQVTPHKTYQLALLSPQESSCP